MEYWEFLLQKEGDQSWLPLDVSQVEILEGRYRVMAHSSQAQAPVHVQISQRLLNQVPPKRRTLRRQGKTNDDGLMVVMPFTRLSAGIWDIQCSAGDTEETLPATADTSGDQASRTWRYAIQLRIIAQGTDEDSDWFADEGTTPRGSTFPESLRSAASAQPPPPSPAPVWPQLDLTQVTDALNQARQHLATAPEAQQDGLYKIELSQTALVGGEGQPIGLTGQVRGVVAGESCSDMALVVRLLDPQTAEVLTLTPFALGSSALPTGINLTVTLPPQLSTRLLVGEVGLVSLSAGTVNILALQGFTVTVDLSSLFDAIANRAESETDLDVVFPSSPGQGRDEPPSPSTETKTESSVNASTDWTLVDLPQSPPRVVPVVTLPRSSASLPPKIYYPSPHEAKTHRPTLPPTGNVKPSPLTQPTPPDPGDGVADSTSPPAGGDRDSEPDSPASHPVPPPPTATGSVAPATTPATPGQGLTLPPVVQRSSQTLDPATSSRTTQSSPPSKVPLLPSHEAMGFKDLKLQDRFWARLNDLAQNIQQDAHQKRVEQDAAEAQGPDLATDGAEVQEPAAPFVPFAGEVVIYDDADETLGASLGSEPFTIPGDRPNHPTAPSPEAEAEIITPPVPDIDVPDGELVAGDGVMLTLRVPFHPNRLYVKVWLIDPQTRTLVDEPRQVMNLAPNGRGQLEGTLRLTVPMGCLEVWFEAITVDIMTQQESYKATVSRSVTPAGLETPSLDEFEL